MKNSIVGREEEIARLEKYIKSDRSEFVAIYGRRRVGKTFLVKELFGDNFTFRITGRENAGLKEQLVNFSYAITDYFGEDVTVNDWQEAFRVLSKAIERQRSGVKIIFIDELPWLDSPKSHFIGALEYFWNNWASYRSDIKLIVCGSATSWMLKKIINARGGLHNRVTHKILISPFSLRETELYFRKNGFDYERLEILDCYMAVGGVAYYLSLFDTDKSVAENINSLCFTSGGELVDEFSKLYKSLFKKADRHLAVVNTLGRVGKGMTRLELLEQTGMKNNGNVSTILNELEACEFIRSYVPFGKSKKEKLYQLVDLFSLFYLRFMKRGGVFARNYWQSTIGTGAYNAWCGYAFEVVCLHHIDEIIDGLGIGGIISRPCSWAYRPGEQAKTDAQLDEDLRTGAQIDLLIDRKDKTVTVCEMKYSDTAYEIDKSYFERIQARMRTFRKVTGTAKTLTTTFVTPLGLKDDMYARKCGRQITADELFK